MTRGKRRIESRRQNIVDGIKKGAKIGGGTLGSLGLAAGLASGKGVKGRLSRGAMVGAVGALHGVASGAALGSIYGALKKAKGDKE